MTSSFFDELAPRYEEYAQTRRAYLAAVDGLVVERIRGTSLLDVGAGDGRRAIAIAERAGIERLVLLEPSEAMRRLCRARPAPPGMRIEVLELRAEDLGSLSEGFDNVTCLWNVLGHVPTREARLLALRGIAARMGNGAGLLLDVQNRYNAAAYGLRRVVGNWVRDRCHPRRANGERSVEIVVGDRVVRGRGYLFSPREMADLFAEAGLEVRERIRVDYRTGSVVHRRLSGQLFYELRRPGKTTSE